jgi:hypothetical protein
MSGSGYLDSRNIYVSMYRDIVTFLLPEQKLTSFSKPEVISTHSRSNFLCIEGKAKGQEKLS